MSVGEWFWCGVVVVIFIAGFISTFLIKHEEISHEDF